MDCESVYGVSVLKESDLGREVNAGVWIVIVYAELVAAVKKPNEKI